MKHNEMFGDARWVYCPGGDCAPVFIRDFEAREGENAEITICGLGFFELYINGRRVSGDLLVPSASNYSYRDMSKWSYPVFDDMSFRIYCMKYDISEYIRGGINSLRVMLGTGYYHQYMCSNEGRTDFGICKLCYIIRKDSGDVLSDRNTLCHKGYFEKCNLYFGENQNYMKMPSPSDFSESTEIDPPESEFEYPVAPPDRVIESIYDIKFMGEYDGARYYDCGINTVGYAVLRCDTPGEHFRVDYAEEIGGKENFGIHFSSDGRYSDEFTSDGKQEEYHERFGWQGFRYFRITGNAEPVRVDVVHTDCKVTSSFECDNEVINWLYKTFLHTQLCNMHSGVPSDCPHRERLGYTGDGQLCAESVMLMFDSRDFYRKWLYDISDCQCKKSGHVQHTAPMMGGGGGPCGWGGAVVEVPYRFYKIFGEKSVLEEFFPKMLKFFDYLDSRSENGLVYTEEEGGWCLGDWLPPQPIQIPETFVNSCLYIRFIQQVKEIARIIGREDVIPSLDEREARIKKAVDVAYYSPQQRKYCGDINGASCLALQAGLGNERVRNETVSKYRNLGQFDTGIIATEVLIRYLFETGEGNLAFDLLSNDKDVSFSHMMKSGATTIWENWNGQSSRNHPMFGAVTKNLFTYLLGIKQPEDSCGFEKVEISPVFVDGLNRASGHITTVKGIISVEYEKKDGRAFVKVYTDPSVSAEFVYGQVREKLSGNAEFEVQI